ncbi:hypothetical protein NEOLI_001368 [Neolecta irregularis DAH-3]|uniref:Uncharacterized protein n=1 Tax=Neolecta irregularis (strain DAH-3) TaxID=1198029 RepID=A0A1U7LHP2_NEOID|nr:hypothetical protein NEOLI_001368 [Neolecta irregularis DAH-3]|eukprot:OLL22113.1 hypothetical protein NEOLI_001368 [Neolecta irregularis DAH-3]
MAQVLSPVPPRPGRRRKPFSWLQRLYKRPKYHTQEFQQFTQTPSAQASVKAPSSASSDENTVFSKHGRQSSVATTTTTMGLHANQNFAGDAASMLTLASSSRRIPRRNSLDTDASIKAIPPHSRPSSIDTDRASRGPESLFSFESTKS